MCVLVPEDQLRQEENQVQEDKSDEGNEKEDPLEDLYSTKSHSPSIPTDADSENEEGGKKEQVQPRRKKKKMKDDRNTNSC